VTSLKSFGSDNYAGAHEAVMRMVSAANTGDAHAYGADSWTERATAELRDLFGAGGGVYLVFNGTAANVLGLSLLVRPYEAVICAESAHLNVDECGAPERVLGTKLLPVLTKDGKLTPELIAGRLTGRGDEHRAQPRAVAITQVTELGTCYTLDELHAIGEFCRSHSLLLYLDGARLANAAAHLGCDLADLAADVDVLSFGGTKNGALGVEAVVVMAEGLDAGIPFQRKQQMQLASKMRFLAAQFLGLLEDGVWLENARHANEMARRLADGVGDIPGIELRQPVESNAIFAAMNPRDIEPLQRQWGFHIWDAHEHVVRWMTAFDTSAADVDAFVASVRAVSSVSSF
jgi:threonine aldolase